MYWRSGSLFAVPFDARRLELAGSPVPILEGVEGYPGNGRAAYSFSEAGSLVYKPGGPTASVQHLAWVDRQGKVQPIPAPPQYYYDVRLSPDGKRVTFAQGDAGKQTLAWTLADGSGQPEALAQTEAGGPTSWSPDGKLLASNGGPFRQTDILLLPLPDGRGSERGGSERGAPQPFLKTQHDEEGAIFSPDGRWIAYSSRKSGQYQVYVRPAAAGAGGKWPVSTGGVFGDVGSGALASYDAAADGKRFVVIHSGAELAAATSEVHFVLEWFEDIRRQVRAGG